MQYANFAMPPATLTHVWPVFFCNSAFEVGRKYFLNCKLNFDKKIDCITQVQQHTHTRVGNENSSRGFLHFMKLRTVDISKCIKYTL